MNITAKIVNLIKRTKKGQSDKSRDSLKEAF
jgi:hypothetical protein